MTRYRLDSQFHCSHLDSRGVPEKPREMISLSFPVHDFRWRHFRWRHIRWCNFRSRLRTRSLPAPPHCTTSNARWMVLLFYSPYHRTNFESGDKHHNLGMDKVTHYTYCDFPGYSKCGKNILWHFSCDFFSYLSCDFLSWDFFPFTIYIYRTIHKYLYTTDKLFISPEINNLSVVYRYLCIVRYI